MFSRLRSPAPLLEPPASTRGLARPVGAEPVALLRAVASAARELFAPDFDAGLRSALRTLVDGARLDRVYVVRYDRALAAGLLIAEHAAAGIETVTSRFGAGPYGYVDFEPVWRSLMAGDTYTPSRAEKPAAQPGLAGDTVAGEAVAGETVTTRSHLVPLVVHGSFWGAVGFDAGDESVAWAARDVTSLQSAAACIASALERRESERARLDAEKARADEAHELNRLLQGVVDASRALLEAPMFEQGLQRWLEYVARAADADHARLGGFPSADDQRSAAFSARVWNRSGGLPDAEMIIPDTVDFRDWAKRLARGECIWAHRDELTDPASVAFWLNSNCFSDLIVPIVLGGRTVGWVSLDWASKRTWKERYCTLLRTAADGAAAAIERNEVAQALLAEREARAADLTRANQAMHRAIAGLASLGELDVFLTDMLRESISAVGAAGGAVELLDGAEARHRIAIGDDGVLSPGAPAELGSKHPSALERITRVPLRVGAQVLGWMGLVFDVPVALSPDKVALLGVLGDQMTLALKLRRLAQEAQAAATQAAVLSERNRLARDLHDTLAQGFAGVIAQLGAAEGAVELRQWTEATAYFERARHLARFSLAEARTSVHALRTETSAGPLRQRLERMVSSMTHGTGLESAVHESGSPILLSPTADWCAYKFVQEALANAVKHSGAKRFCVELAWDADRVRLCAVDDGRGFALDQVREGLGFLSMRERAAEAGGALRHEVQPGGGTRLCLELPLRMKDLP